jgi:hypothetical protein
MQAQARAGRILPKSLPFIKDASASFDNRVGAQPVHSPAQIVPQETPVQRELAKRKRSESDPSNVSGTIDLTKDSPPAGAPSAVGASTSPPGTEEVELLTTF